jgi:Domain of unknown function (DUF4357)
MSKPNQRPFSIRMFLPDGDPDGLRLVEKSNWTGIGLVFKRSSFKDTTKRPEFDKTGVYILVGTSEDSSLPTVYIGEGDPVRPRIDNHYAKKDFWDWGIFFVSKDDSLNKAHVRLLESRLIKIAQEAKQSKLDNVVTPTEPTLSEAERADVESFLLDILSIFPLVGLSVFDKLDSPERTECLLHLASNKGAVGATGYEGDKGFVVCKGSLAVLKETASCHNYMRTIRKDLQDQGILVEQAGYLEFTQDRVFNSPSTAAGIVLGRPNNGRVLWKDEGGRTLKDIQSEAAKIDTGRDDDE